VPAQQTLIPETIIALDKRLLVLVSKSDNHSFNPKAGKN
jgi:hypothetical protein